MKGSDWIKAVEDAGSPLEASEEADEALIESVGSAEANAFAAPGEVNAGLSSAKKRRDVERIGRLFR